VALGVWESPLLVGTLEPRLDGTQGQPKQVRKARS